MGGGIGLGWLGVRPELGWVAAVGGGRGINLPAMTSTALKVLVRVCLFFVVVV